MVTADTACAWPLCSVRMLLACAGLILYMREMRGLRCAVSGGRQRRPCGEARRALLDGLLSAGHRLPRALIISDISMAAEYFYPHVGAELRMLMCGSCGEAAKRAAGVSI